MTTEEKAKGRMTPLEFLKEQLPTLHGHALAGNIAVAMELYANHCEESAWVTDGSLPPVNEGAVISNDVAIITKNGKKFIGYYNHDRAEWYDMDRCDWIPYEIERWRNI